MFCGKSRERKGDDAFPVQIGSKQHNGLGNFKLISSTLVSVFEQGSPPRPPLPSLEQTEGLRRPEGFGLLQSSRSSWSGPSLHHFSPSGAADSHHPASVRTQTNSGRATEGLGTEMQLDFPLFPPSGALKAPFAFRLTLRSTSCRAPACHAIAALPHSGLVLRCSAKFILAETTNKVFS